MAVTDAMLSPTQTLRIMSNASFAFFPAAVCTLPSELFLNRVRPAMIFHGLLRIPKWQWSPVTSAVG